MANSSKNKKKKIKLAGIIFIAILIVIIILVNPLTLVSKIKLNNLKYSKESIKNSIEYKVDKEVIKLGYNKTLDIALKDKNYKKANFKEYSKIKYVKQDNFIDNINKLLKKKYSVDDINLINKTASKKDIDNLLSKDIILDIDKYLEYDYAKVSNIDRYVAYKEANDYSYEEVVTLINIGIDKDFYDDPIEVKDFNEKMLVNKYRSLPENYEPENLTTIDINYATDETQKATKETVDAFLEMAKDAEKQNLHMIANSSYRSYQEQKDIYDLYEKKYGGQYAKEYAALPGFSEHQTGYVIDIANKNHQIFDGTGEFQWLKKNAYKYGFILRYPQDKEKITGYAYESWHYRYVGRELAKKVVDSGLTYDEYYTRYLDK